MKYRTLVYHPPAVFRLQIETLTPLHIGTGTILRRDYDFAVHNSRTWVINQEAVATDLFELGNENAAWKQLVQGRPSAEMLSPNDFRMGDPHFYYSMPGVPSAQSTGSEVREMMKNPWHEPYIPGSSLKGALRTGFLWRAFQELGKTPTMEMLDAERSPKVAARPLERSIVATQAPDKRVPNYDIFKAMQVSDSNADKNQSMAVVNVQLQTRGGSTIPLVVEGIRPDVTFSATLTFDRALRDHLGPENLGWQKDTQLRWLTGIRNCVNSWSAKRVKKELQFWKGRSADIIKFYKDLYRRISEAEMPSQQGKTSKECYLQLGWGTGWGSKTLGNLLSDDTKLMDQIVDRYPRAMNPQKSYKQGTEFPSGRRAVLFQNQPIAPLGWLKITFEQK